MCVIKLITNCILSLTIFDKIKKFTSYGLKQTCSANVQSFSHSQVEKVKNVQKCVPDWFHD